MGMFSPETRRLRQLLAEQMTHTTGQPAQTQYTLPQVARRMWPEIEQALWDMSPGVGDWLSWDRGANNLYQAGKQIAGGDLSGAKQLPGALMDMAGAIPGIGDIATAGKGLAAALPALAAISKGRGVSPDVLAGKRWYHGTLNDFDNFDADNIYQNTFRPVDDAVWLTDSPAYASWINDKKAGKVVNEGRVLDVQADVSNPLKIDILAEGRRVAEEIGAEMPETAMEAQELLSGGMGWDAVVAQWINEARAAGHDALELANFHDNWSINAGKTTNAMLVFDPKKAKIIK